MEKNRNKPEFKKQLSNGTLLYINQIGDDTHGNKCFLITDTSDKNRSFLITVDGLPFKGEILTEDQQLLIPQIKGTILEISSS